MDLQEELAQNLTAESEAYGYTLSIWGGGAILINQYGTPNVTQVFLYVSGALAAFMVLAVIAFRHLFANHETTVNRQLIIASMIHLVATLGSLGLTYLIAKTTFTSVLTENMGFFLTGFQLTLTYNLLVLLERAFAQTITLFDLSPEEN